MNPVLYVDDESDLLDIGKIYLERTGHFTVDTAVSAQAALKKIQTAPYEAIISDYQMPGMDGIALLKEVRSRFGDIPFILFTGRGREEVVIEALNSGADFYLQKGGDPQSQFAELAHKIRMAVQHRNAEERLIVQNRLYSVLSAINRAIIHIQDRSEFLSEICRVLVEIGGFRMVWIGLADTTKKRIEPVASFGHIDGYLDHIDISTEDVPNGRGSTGTAYREGNHYVSNDILRDPRMDPWREAASRRGYLANAAFPFALGTRNAGVISLYAPKAGFFDEQVISLLAEISRDISFALRTIDDEVHRKSADEALKENQERLSLALTAAGMGTFDWDILNNIWTWDDQAYHLLGVRSGTFFGTEEEFFHIIHPDDQAAVRAAFAQASEAKIPFDTQFRVVWPDGSTHTIAATGRINSDNEGRVVWLTGIWWDISDQKKAEETLTTRDRIFNHSLDMLCIAGFDGYFKVLNPAWSKTLGWSTEELLAKPWLEYVYPEDREATATVRSVLINGEEVYQFENRYICKDGSIKWLSWNSFPYPEEKIMFGVARDVTDRKRIEESLRTSEERFHSLFDHMIDGIALHKLIVDEAGAAIDYRILEVNSAFETLLGIRKETILGKSSREAYGTADPPYLAIYSRIALGGEPYSFETFFAPMKKHFFISVYSPRPGYFATVFEDITERKQMENALKESEQFLDTVVEQIPDMIFIKDAQDLRYVRLNKAGERLLGYAREEMQGKGDHDLFPKAEADFFSDKDREVLSTNQMTDIPEERIQTRDKGERILHTKKIPLFDDEGRPKYLMGISEDITDKKRAEERINLTNRKLALMTDVTYQDIQNKLAGLAGYVELSKRPISEDDRLSLIQKEEVVLETIHHLIINTKDYQQMGVDQLQWIPLERTIHVQASLTSRKPDISLDIDLHGLEIYADPLINRVMYNLIDNAIKHGETITRLSFRYREAPDGIIIICEDDGIGIPLQGKAHIFDRVVGGEGRFGLFFVREFLTLSGMAIEETGEAGTGARFEITVPKGMYRFSGAP